MNTAKKLLVLGLTGGGGLPWYQAGNAPAPVVVYLPKGAADLAASYVNLVTPGTYDLAPGDAPTFNTATGWTFNGTSNYLVSAASAALKPLSVVARVKFANTTGYPAIVGASNNGGWSVRLSSGGTPSGIQLLKQGVAIVGEATSTVNQNTDYILAVTYSAAGAFVFYIDGGASGSGTNDVAPTAGTLKVGLAFGGDFWKGIISALAIYNAVLTEAQVVAIGAEMAAK